MARPLRIAYPGAFYHVTCCGNENRPIFRDDQERRAFLQRLSISLTNYQIPLHAYVLMTNHFHFVLEPPLGNLSEFMRHFNARVARVLRKDVKELCRRGGGLERAIVMECLHPYAQERQQAIGQRMGGVDYIWVSRMRNKLRRAVQTENEAKRLFPKVEAALLTHE